MSLRLQELTACSNGAVRSLTVQTTIAWKCVIGIVALLSAVLGVVNGPVGIVVAGVVVLLALPMAFFSNTLIVDSTAKQLVLRSGIGPIRGVSAIPFGSIKMITISDGGTIRGYGLSPFGATTCPRATYSLALEIAGRSHVKTLLNGVDPNRLVSEAQHLATVCGKSVFIPSALQ
jgi:hypothetical protein